MLMGKVAVVTGGSRGIGRAIATSLAADGANVALIAKNPEWINRSVRDLPQIQSHQKHMACPCDVSDSVAVNSVIRDIEKTIGPAYVLVNSAGICKDSLLIRASDDDVYTQINTNLLGTIFMTRAVLKGLIRANGGHIINIGSVIGKYGNAGQSIYSASKAGLVGFTKSMALEVGSRGIRVNMIEPGFIETEMTKDILSTTRLKIIDKTTLGRLGTPEDVVHAVQLLLRCDYITGQVVTVDGGLSL